MYSSAKHQKISRTRRNEAILGVTFALPWILGFGLLYVFPIGSSIVYSFTNFNGGTQMDFVGFQNYVSAFAHNMFRIGLNNTLWFVGFNVVLSTVLGVALGFLVKPRVAGMKLFRTIYYIPNVISGLAVAFLWQWIFNDLGPINAILERVGAKPIGWLSDTGMVKPTLLVMQLWGIGAMILIYLAALQGVPQELYEAAQIDGAGTARRFVKITMPMIMPTIVFNIMMTVISSFQVFLNAYMVTGGGPNNASFFLGQLIYEEAYVQNHYGFASALSWILMAIMFSVAIMINTLSKRYAQH